MKTLRMALSATLLLTGCTFDVPDLNRPGVDSLQNPTPSAVEALATGLLIGARKGYTERVGAVVEWGVLGREALVLTPSDPRFVSELLQGDLSPGSNNFGGNFWVIPYSNIRGANLLLHALDNPALLGLSDAQKDSMRGFAKTIQALDYLQVVDAHDSNGAVLNVDFPLGAAPPPIVNSTDQIFIFIEKLLDDAQTPLNNAITASAAFPFPLGSGFAGFDTPATFLKFNRALRARVAVYHGKNDDALAAIAASFVDGSLPFKPNVGTFHAYSGGTGDLANDINTPDILCHASVVTDAETLASPPAGCTKLACLDNRVSAKVTVLDKPVALSNHSSGYGFMLYPKSESSIAIIRNEELILLRAEANIGKGNIADAAKDINFIRKNSGGLVERGDLTAGNILDELLKQKRYSLLFEGGHRWIDLRRYGKLSTLPLDIPADKVNDKFPIPITESQAR